MQVASWQHTQNNHILSIPLPSGTRKSLIAPPRAVFLYSLLASRFLCLPFLLKRREICLHDVAKIFQVSPHLHLLKWSPPCFSLKTRTSCLIWRDASDPAAEVVLHSFQWPPGSALRLPRAHGLFRAPITVPHRCLLQKWAGLGGLSVGGNGFIFHSSVQFA